MNLSNNEAKMCFCLDSCTFPTNSEVISPVNISRRTQGENVLLEPTSNLASKMIKKIVSIFSL